MTTIKVGSKYHPLYEHLLNTDADMVVLSFDEIEAILKSQLASSALSSKAFWSNRGRGALQALAWMNAGYHVIQVNLERGQVTFEKPEYKYDVRVEGDTVLWDGNMVRALRAHMDLSQQELAETMGVRQQTVSEWENGIYTPTRSRSKHLSMVAEGSGFGIKHRENLQD
jgi:DNA-binding transcriptional regulator YiaG